MSPTEYQRESCCATRITSSDSQCLKWPKPGHSQATSGPRGGRTTCTEKQRRVQRGSACRLTSHVNVRGYRQDKHTGEMAKSMKLGENEDIHGSSWRASSPERLPCSGHSCPPWTRLDGASGIFSRCASRFDLISGTFCYQECD